MLQDISQAELTQNWDAVIAKCLLACFPAVQLCNILRMYGTHYVSEVRVGGLMQAFDVIDAGCAVVCERKAAAKPTASMLISINYLSGKTPNT